MPLKNHRKIESGKLWDAKFSQETYFYPITFNLPFGRGCYEKNMECFDYKNKTYAITGYDHFNGHFSGFRDQSAIYGIHIAEVVQE